MKLDEWKTLRKSWSDTCDKLKFPKTPVAGVDLGDLIERVWKAAPKGIAALVVALTKLSNDTKRYKAAILKTSPELARWIGDHLEKRIAVLKVECELNRKALRQAYKIALVTHNEIKRRLPLLHRLEVAAQRSQIQSTDWAAAVKYFLIDYAGLSDVCRKAARMLSKVTPKMTLVLPSRPLLLKAHTNALKDFFISHKVLKRLSEAKDWSQFAEIMKHPQHPDVNRYKRRVVALRTAVKNYGVGQV